MGQYHCKLLYIHIILGFWKIGLSRAAVGGHLQVPATSALTSLPPSPSLHARVHVLASLRARHARAGHKLQWVVRERSRTGEFGLSMSNAR
jgi:hypothetical protein